MILLAQGAGNIGPTVACAPNTVRFDHRGVRFALDANSLKLAVLEEGEKEKEVLPGFSADCKPSFQLQTIPAPGAICFDMTRACNLKCTYCFAQNDAGRNASKHLTFDDAMAGLAVTIPRAMRDGTMKNRRLQFSFFGGEPLLRWDLIVRLVEHIKIWLPCNSHFHVTTNGVLMTPEIASYMEENHFSTIISIDGTEEAHNECRVFADGKGSYSGALRALEIMKEHAPSVVKSTTLRSTFTPNSIRNESLARRVEHLNDLIEQGFGGYASIEPAFLGEATCADRALVAEQTTDYDAFKAMWEKQYDDAADLWLERLAQDKAAYFHHFISYPRRMVASTPGCSECGAGKGYYTIAPGGDLYACHHEGGTLIGNAYSGGIDAEIAAPWQDNRYYARLKCPGCPIRNICGGGCREYSVSEGLGVSHPVKNECDFKMTLIKNAAWLMFKTLPDEKLREKVMKYWGARKKNTCGPKQ